MKTPRRPLLPRAARRLLSGAVLLLALSPAMLCAQAPPTPTPAPANPAVTDTEAPNAFWDCTLPGGNYTVLLGKISVVSLHEFNLVGGRVTELNIVTEGDALARFYFMEALLPGGGTAAADLAKTRLTELANTAADRTGTEKIWQKVQKDYPLATHAHTIEFRMQTKADLLSLHASAKKAWTSGHGRIVTVK
ncbi:MAG: hypothetical protein JWL81_664 [Verrucomicrobiales bacterium]|nr:hypothetical protein [Verrucomicrobiales bacterium]